MTEIFGKIMMFVGLLIVLFGAALWGISRLLGGRHLPGDIVVSRPGFTFFFPIATSIIISLLLTLVLWLVLYFRR